MDYNSFIQVLSVSLIFPMLFFNLHYSKASKILESDFIEIKGNLSKEQKKRNEINTFIWKTWFLQVVLPTTVIAIPNIFLFLELLKTTNFSFENIDYFRLFYFFLAIFLFGFIAYIANINIKLFNKKNSLPASPEDKGKPQLKNTSSDASNNEPLKLGAASSSKHGWWRTLMPWRRDTAKHPRQK